MLEMDTLHSGDDIILMP